MDDRLPPASSEFVRSPSFWLQILAAMALAGVGVYLAMTARWGMGAIIFGVGLTVLPWPAASLIGGIVLLGAAGAGWYFNRITVLVAIIVAVLGVLAIGDRMRAMGGRRSGE